MALASLSEVTPLCHLCVNWKKKKMLLHDTSLLENCQDEYPVRGVYNVDGCLEQCTTYTPARSNPTSPRHSQPHLVNIPDATALPRHKEATITGTQFTLDAEEQHLQVPLLLKPEGAGAQEPRLHTATCRPPS